MQLHSCCRNKIKMRRKYQVKMRHEWRCWTCARTPREEKEISRNVYLLYFLTDVLEIFSHSWCYKLWWECDNEEQGISGIVNRNRYLRHIHFNMIELIEAEEFQWIGNSIDKQTTADKSKPTRIKFHLLWISLLLVFNSKCKSKSYSGTIKKIQR